MSLLSLRKLLSDVHTTAGLESSTGDDSANTQNLFRRNAVTIHRNRQASIFLQGLWRRSPRSWSEMLK